MRVKPSTIIADNRAELRLDVANAFAWREGHRYECDCEPCYAFDVALGGLLGVVEVAEVISVNAA